MGVGVKKKKKEKEIHGWGISNIENEKGLFKKFLGTCSQSSIE